MEKEDISFIDFLTIYDCGIKRHTTCIYAPQQNEVAERENNHIVEVDRAIYVHMNTCQILIVHSRTPKDTWSGKKPDVAYSNTYLDMFVMTMYLMN